MSEHDLCLVNAIARRLVTASLQCHGCTSRVDHAAVTARRSPSCALTTTGDCSQTTVCSRRSGCPADDTQESPRRCYALRHDPSRSIRFDSENCFTLGSPEKCHVSRPRTLRLSGMSDGYRLRPLSSPGMSGVDRVLERQGAAALARHYRDEDGLSIAEIARRLGTRAGTVKVYDPTGEKARAVGVVIRACVEDAVPQPLRAAASKGDAYKF